jgi:hypothetical protein
MLRTPEQQAAVEAYIEKLRPKYEGFLARLAEEAARDWQGEFSPDVRWLSRELDTIVTANVSWNRARRAVGYRGPEDDVALYAAVDSIVEHNPKEKVLGVYRRFGGRQVDDARVLQLIQPYVPKESDQRVFLAMCHQLESEMWENDQPMR